MKRNSSIELLRIVAMLMIILGHLAGHGILHMISDDALQIWWGGGTLNKLFCILLLPGGRVGVGVFFLITGYFMINKSSVSIKKVLTETMFYSLVLSLAAFIFGFGSIKDVARSIVPLSNNSWWFVTSYIILVLCAPTINRFYLSLSRKNKLVCLIAAWLFIYAIPYIYGNYYYGLERGLLFYLIGAYIKTEISIEKMREWRLPCLFICLVLWICYLPIGYWYYSGGLEKSIVGILMDGVLYNAMIVPACAVTLFLLFLSIKPFYSRTVNVVAGTTLGIYLLHDTKYRYYFWDSVVRINKYYLSPWFPLIAVIIGIIIFVLFGVVDYGRQRVFSLIKEKSSVHK